MEKDKLIKTFDEEISSGISAIQNVKINTDEYGKAVDNIAVLTEKTIKLKELEVKQMQLEMEKSRHDEELRIERMRAEAEIDKQQAETKSRKWDKWIDRGIKILEIGVPVVTVIWGTHYTFKYESEGYMPTTLLGKGFVNKLLPKK